ncbi:MAG TPA: hypothetical protein ENN61_05635 [Bacteroidaceae bacterium]|nr:hypothetical protein [Bacteroidaceae bacterium]
MNDIEKYMMENRPEFNTEEPKEGHFDRFNKRLISEKRPVKLNFRHIIQIAASIAILVAAGWFIIDKSKSGDKVAGHVIPEEVIEAEDYFIRQVTVRYDQIEGFYFQSEQEKAILLDELKDLDIYFQKLMEDLETNPSDERIINAMIRHYQLKLEIMDQIINQLHQIKTQKTGNHEEENV